jgi:23S rRNA pseudouridine2605 synthase
MNNSTGIRLHVYMMRCGIGSRRQCERFIDEKRVSVNGKIVESQGLKLNENDLVLFDGKYIKPVPEKIYIALNKPVRFLCSNRDDSGKPLAGDLLKGAFDVRLYHVGRLDFMSSGLIFYTNDGNFAQIVSHPPFEIEKEYIVYTRKAVPENMLIEYKKGIIIDNISYKLKEYRILTPRKISLFLVEGKNREIRKVFKKFEIEIKRIHRVRIGVVSINNISSGEYRHLNIREINWFLNRKKML